MPTTSQPTDQPYGQLITDEKALERLFREHYARLLEDAKRRLGDASGAAPRVVSKAFHLAWNDRKRFHSMEELEAFFGANIQHGAARELSRLAGLHRIDSAGGGGGGAGGHKETKHEVAEMSVDEAWERLQQTLQGGTPDAYRARASTARHEAAEHVAALGKQRSWKRPIIVGVAGALVVATAVWYFDKAGASAAIDRALADPDARAYDTGAGQQANVTLDDGTVVRLGPESKLTVPRRFGLTGGFRAVRLDGIAHFDVVSPTMDPPFELRSSGVAIVAQGTSFTVRRFGDDPGLVLHVREGSVQLRVGQQERVVPQGLSFMVDSAGAISVPSADRIDETRTWVDGNVTIVGRKLRYVLPQLKRWYGLDIRVPDLMLLDRDVFVRAALSSPREAIASVEKSGGLKFTYVGENMAFQDTTPTRGARGR